MAKKKMKKVAVFAGSECAPKLRNKMHKLAFETGKLLAKSGFTIINGGGPSLMNEVLRGASEAGGKTIGVCLDFPGRAHSKFIDEFFLFTELRPRQKKMLSLADAFIALPGGVGTLYEVAEIMALKRIGEIKINKPLVLINSYYRDLIQIFNKMKSAGFAPNSIDSYFYYTHSVKGAVDLLKHHL